jgi:hypothetical protein
MAIADSSIGPRTVSRRWRRALAVLGGLLLAFLIGIGAYSLLDIASRHSFDVSASYTGVRSLAVDGGSGDVHLTGGAAGAGVVVVEHITEGLFAPHREAVRSAGGALHLSASCQSTANNCGVSYTIAVPPGVSVHADSGGGSIDARGLSATTLLELRSGSGDVNALDVSATNVTLESGNGDVTATLDQASTRLDASSANGDINLTVPDTTYAVRASADNGTVSDQTLRTDPSARRAITAHSGNGDVTIRAAGAPVS